MRNTGDRPIQVGSHFHFFEVNRALDFDRARRVRHAARHPGRHAVRFEPGDEREVELVAFGGERRVRGLNRADRGRATGTTAREAALRPARAARLPGGSSDGQRMSSRRDYASCSARPPATGSGWATPTCWPRSSTTSRVYGDECVSGGGKTMRDGMGLRRRATNAAGALDLVVSNAW